MPEHPYSPSWVDRLTDWIDRLPFPNVLFYLIVYLVAAAAMHLGAWIDEAAEWGRLEPQWFTNAVFVVMSLAAIHNLDRIAERSVATFRPLLDSKAAAALKYEMTTMPARTVLWITILSALFVATVFGTNPDFAYSGMSHPASWGLLGAAVVWGYTFAPLLIYYILRQLRTIRHAYEMVDEVSIFRQRILYAFSRLSFWSGMTFLLIANAAVADAVVRDLDDSEMVLSYLFALPLLVLAFVAFIAPLRGIHNRLKQEKGRIIEENGEHIELAHQRLYEAVSDADHAAVDSADKAIGSLYRVRDEIHKVHTWPWSPGTVRSFLSAVFVPMIVWALQLWGDRLI